MNFDDSPQESIYRATVREWLANNAPRYTVSRRAPEKERLVIARAWQACKAAAGYARVSWPRDWGGAGGTTILHMIFTEEEARYGVPSGFFGIGLGMCIPTLMRFAGIATQQRFAGPALRGEQIWCQLFSEPGAGSDLAASRTRAVWQDDSWLVNGQKAWTTGAHYSDYGLLLARTDASVPKHTGLTMFWIDMKTPGVDVRPIHQMSGGSDFNEVYLTDARVPDSQRVGDVGAGWKVSLVTLMNERVEGGKDRGPTTEQILALARSIPLGTASVLEDPAFRQKLAMWYVQAEGLRFTRLRTLTALSRGQIPGPESSIGKLVAANRLQDLTNELIECQDQFGLIDDAAHAAMGGSLHYDYLYAPGLRIAGGTDEILKNIIGERVLGLPGDIRVDKGIAFKDLPTGR
ncbi:MAG TPA: acyl-CoA dehydrogenase family protein [Steroidobacteraceae bacterium]|nr:acyl-CoA dehydrogenase family protein [Steroidobacteraceae bacterium]